MCNAENEATPILSDYRWDRLNRQEAYTDLIGIGISGTEARRLLNFMDTKPEIKRLSRWDRIKLWWRRARW